MRTCIRRCCGILALALFSGILAAGCNTRADTPKPVRITVARSVSGIPLWGIGPFAETSGFRVEYIPAGTNAEMQRNLQRRRDRHSGLSKPGRDGRAECCQCQDRGGRAVGRTEPDHAQGRRDQILEGSRRQAHRPAAGKLCSHPVHACGQGKWRGPLQGQPAQHHLGRSRPSCRRSRAEISTAWCYGLR